MTFITLFETYQVNKKRLWTQILKSFELSAGCFAKGYACMYGHFSTVYKPHLVSSF